MRVYVEGGGDANALRTKCRRGFSEFFRKAGFEGRMPKVVACGARDDAFDDFCTALAQAHGACFPVLLVDSEAVVETEPWPHLKLWDNWDKPDDASADHAHLMVETMEAWFVADRDSLAAYFGREFNTNALPARNDVESISKAELYQSLKNATRLCNKKGEYDKGAHSFEILALIDPDVVRSKSPHTERLITTLHRKADGK
ncbi:MAG: DUF4276 family protein [Phycisphaerae bacterium]|nr:DUF4276 family protein [Phycisphaerae bacterium]